MRDGRFEWRVLVSPSFEPRPERVAGRRAMDCDGPGLRLLSVDAGVKPPPILLCVLTVDVEPCSCWLAGPGEKTKLRGRAPGASMGRFEAARSLSFRALGTPSHLVLTFGTVGGSFAEDTPSWTGTGVRLFLSAAEAAAAAAALRVCSFW